MTNLANMTKEEIIELLKTLTNEQILELQKFILGLLKNE